MFNVSGGEIIVILLLALVVLGPEKLPEALRRAGRTYAELKKMGNSFQTEMRSVLDEPMKEMRDTADLLRKAVDVTVETATTDTRKPPPPVIDEPVPEVAAAEAELAEVTPAAAVAEVTDPEPVAATNSPAMDEAQPAATTAAETTAPTVVTTPEPGPAPEPVVSPAPAAAPAPTPPAPSTNGADEDLINRTLSGD